MITKFMILLAALSFALDAAQNTQTVPGEKKALLLISGKLETNSLDGLKELTTRAQTAGVRVHVWIVDSKANLTGPGALALQDLAAGTGGRYLTFTGSETLPDPEEWISSLHNTRNI